MSFGISFKVTVPKQKYGNKKFLDEIARTQRQTSVPRLRRLFEKTVFGWSKKPTFGWVQRRNSGEISITMYPQGLHEDIWKLVSAGSPRHDIPARKGGMLSFRPGYRSATRPGTLMSRRAYRSGPIWRSKIIYDHPGFAPRNFPELIADEYQNPYMDEIQEAINRVARS